MSKHGQSSWHLKIFKSRMRKSGPFSKNPSSRWHQLARCSWQNALKQRGLDEVRTHDARKQTHTNLKRSLSSPQRGRNSKWTLCLLVCSSSFLGWEAHLRTPPSPSFTANHPTNASSAATCILQQIRRKIGKWLGLQFNPHSSYINNSRTFSGWY